MYDIINKVIELNKQEIFKQEISYVKDSDVKESLCTMIDTIPDYFFHIPASSTGKYHPSYATGDGGLLRHTKVVVRMAKELFGIYKFSSHTKDLIIMACLLHDTIKKGFTEEQYTRFDHPLLAAENLRNHEKELKISKEDIEFVSGCIESHMGRFNTSEYSDVVLPIPGTPEQKFVHMCDYLGARKVIDIHFDKDNNIIEI